MASSDNAIIDPTPHECVLCNAIVFKWIEFDNPTEEYWATEFNRSTCGHTSSFHLVNDFEES